MLNILRNTYKTYFTKFPFLVLFILPLLAYSACDDVLKRFFIGSDFMATWNVLSIVFSALIYTATQIFVYKYLMNIKLGKITSFLKTWAKFFVFHLVVTNLIMIPVLGLMIIAVAIDAGSLAFPIALLANVFVGFWVLARVNVVLPMIVAEDKITPKSVWDFGQSDSYVAWLLPVVGVYLPYVLSYYLIHCEWVKVLVVSVLSILLTVFNVVYYQTKKEVPVMVSKTRKKKKAE